MNPVPDLPQTYAGILRSSRTLDEKLAANWTNELLDQIRDFLPLVAASGKVTHRPEERDVLQGVANYWASVLRVVTGRLVLPPSLEAFAGHTSAAELPRIELEELSTRVRRGQPIIGVLLEREDLAGFKFGTVTMMNCALRNCTLDGARFDPDSDLTHTSFDGSSLKGLVANGVKAAGSRFGKATLTEASFLGANLGAAVFDGAHIQGASFREANLVNSRFDGARYDDRTSFRASTLVSSYLRYMRGAAADFSGANISSGSDLSGSVLARCRFEGTELIRSKLVQVDFTHANLRKAILQEADIDGSDFRGARLTDANFMGAVNAIRAHFDPSAVVNPPFGLAEAMAASRAELRASEHEGVSGRLLDEVIGDGSKRGD